MRIDRLKLTNFRNYSDLDVGFSDGVNFLYGRNASGKTNIVEAIAYLSLGKSFRTNEDSALIRWNEAFARIEANYFRKGTHTLRAVVGEKGKSFELDGIRLEKLSSLSGELIALTFIPEDVSLLKDSPSVRRKFLNISLAHLYRRYIRELGGYKKILKDRNAHLKSETVDPSLLDVFDEQLAAHAYRISSDRRKLLKTLEEEIQEIYGTLTEEKRKIEIRYLCDFPDIPEQGAFLEEAKRMYRNEREGDLKRKMTNAGIHRDDFEIRLDGKNAAEYASQGQNRLLALSLKLAYGEIVKKQIGDDPILILDDVLSELDRVHQARLSEKLSDYQQIFITSACDEDIGKTNKYQVADDLVIRRN